MNGEMDFMILNNKVKGVQGTVDNIDKQITDTGDKIDSVSTIISEVHSTSDNINTNVSNILNHVKQSGTTANSTGTLSEKLSYIIEQNNVIENTISAPILYLCSDNAIKSVISSEKQLLSSASDGTFLDNAYISTGIGTIRLRASVKVLNSGHKFYMYYMHVSAADGSNTTGIIANVTSGSSYVNGYTDISVAKGDILRFYVTSTNASVKGYCNSLKICGDIIAPESI